MGGFLLLPIQLKRNNLKGLRFRIPEQLTLCKEAKAVGFFCSCVVVKLAEVAEFRVRGAIQFKMRIFEFVDLDDTIYFLFLCDIQVETAS